MEEVNKLLNDMMLESEEMNVIFSDIITSAAVEYFNNTSVDEIKNMLNNISDEEFNNISVMLKNIFGDDIKKLIPEFTKENLLKILIDEKNILGSCKDDDINIEI